MIKSFMRAVRAAQKQLQVLMLVTFIGAALVAPAASVAQNLGTAPATGQAVQGQTAAQPEGAFLNLVNWVCNVPCPVGAGIAVVATVLQWRSGRSWLPSAMTAGGLICVSGILRLIEYFIAQGQAVEVSMQTPLVFRAILGLLMDLAIPAALGAFVMAGMRLRSEGGMNFEASGGFLKWLFWGCLLISLPGVSLWLSNEGIPGASLLTIAGATGAPYTQGVEKVTNDFVNNFLVAHVVPVVAASLVFKAILDLSQGYSPLASVIAALFLLGVQGIYNLATGSWMQSGDQYGVTDMLMQAFGYAANRISPIVGGLALSGAIANYVRHRPWGGLVASGLAFLSVTGIWALVTHFAGVNL
jgi:hypothetical protein